MENAISAYDVAGLTQIFENYLEEIGKGNQKAPSRVNAIYRLLHAILEVQPNTNTNKLLYCYSNMEADEILFTLPKSIYLKLMEAGKMLEFIYLSDDHSIGQYDDHDIDTAPLKYKKTREQLKDNHVGTKIKNITLCFSLH
jgi:hypothetical protein